MAYGAYGKSPERGGTTGAHEGVQCAPASVVTPQHALHGCRGPPEHGDGMPAAGIAEEQVTEEAGGGAVRVEAFGTHGVNRPWDRSGCRW
ncbi:hypothetical protein GCM10018782_27960 [Streptomyces griseoaurantiacus]|nr:hypothetical protein GCM10018782_27960 [Streptomyces griseoaurantiacus]